MAKKQSFADKANKKTQTNDRVKVVQAVRGANGAWKFRTQMMKLDDPNLEQMGK